MCSLLWQKKDIDFFVFYIITDGLFGLNYKSKEFVINERSKFLDT